MPVLRSVLLGTCLVMLAVCGATPAVGSSPDGAAQASWTGIAAEQYRVTRGEISWADTFTDVLQAHGASYARAVRVAREARPVFDVREMESGKRYWAYVNPWLGEVQYLVYQINAVEHVVFDMRNPGRSRRVQRPVTRRWATVSGRIDGSLYATLTEQGGHPLLALRLSEIFAWQIDFFRLRAGDSLRVVYEQRWVGGERASPGPIVAAYVKHQGERYYGFRFDDAGPGPIYFNRQGESLRRRLLKAPLRYTRISSGYTDSRYHPVLKEWRPHHGTDYAAPTGTPVRAVGSGTVEFAGYDGPNGNYVKIRHNGTFSSGYLHLSQIDVTPGEQVQQGETIGHVGSTGRSTGSHLDYRLWKRGRAVDPYELDLPPSRPVGILERAAFRRQVRTMMRYLHETPVVADRERPRSRRMLSYQAILIPSVKERVGPGSTKSRPLLTTTDAA